MAAVKWGEAGLGKKGIGTPTPPEKIGSGLKKRLANLWCRRKITKKAHNVRG